MDFLTVLKYLVAVLETGALIGALTCGTRGFRENSNSEIRKALLRQTAIYFAAFLVLKMVRFYFFGT